MQKQEQTVGQKMLHTVGKATSTLLMIVVNKEREEEYDSEIDNQWKEARSNFFNNTIKQKLSQTRISQQDQMRIAQIFMEIKQDECSQYLDIGFSKKGEFRKYKQQIAQIIKQFKLINQQFSQMLKQTPVITQIIRLQLTSLTVINIQYDRNTQNQCRYQVKAFDLFKVIHENISLSSVTIKGVKIKNFKQFISVVGQKRRNQLQKKEMRAEQKWINDFNPSKSLKIAIDASDDFDLRSSESDLCAMKDLAQFGAMFQQLSVISVKMRGCYDQWLSIGRQAFLDLFEQLTIMRTIKIKVTIEQRMGFSYFHQPFTTILQMLSSLTTIAHLKLQNFRFSNPVSINRYLAMEQILVTLFSEQFHHSPITIQCQNLPIFPVTPLESIYVNDISFRRKFNFLSELTKSSQSLKQIKGLFIKQQWRIEEQVFNQLQLLQIIIRQNVSLGIQTHLPSKIRSLKISITNSDSLDLSVLFPKLIHITQLYLYSIHFDHQLIWTIPSPHVTYLTIQYNDLFTDKSLEVIDEKWPKLRQLTLKRCPNLKGGSWSVCKFKGLIKLQIDSIQQHRDSILKQFRRRGIRVY